MTARRRIKESISEIIGSVVGREGGSWERAERLVAEALEKPVVREEIYGWITRVIRGAAE